MEKITNFVGIDMAKTSFMAAFNEISEPKQFGNTNQDINCFFKYLKQLDFKKDNTILGVESTGSYHLRLCMACQRSGYAIKVINPLIVKKQNQTDLRRVKNDKKDASLIRYCLVQGNGYQFQETKQKFILKALIRERNALSRTRMQIQRQDQDLKLKQQTIKTKINPVYQQIHQIIAKKIKQIENQLKEFNQPIQTLLRTIPGVGPITAASFVSEIVDIKRFKYPSRQRGRASP